MLSALRVYARNNQAVLVTPFIMAGAMARPPPPARSPNSTPRSLAGIAYAQLVRPGAPMVYGNFVTTVSMQSGAPDDGHARTGDDDLRRDAACTAVTSCRCARAACCVARSSPMRRPRMNRWAP